MIEAQRPIATLVLVDTPCDLSPGFVMTRGFIGVAVASMTGGVEVFVLKNSQLHAGTAETKRAFSGSHRRHAPAVLRKRGLAQFIGSSVMLRRGSEREDWMLEYWMVEEGLEDSPHSAEQSLVAVLLLDADGHGAVVMIVSKVRVDDDDNDAGFVDVANEDVGELRPAIAVVDHVASPA